MVYVTAAVEAAIRRQGEAAYPYEGCGLLLGHSDGRHHQVVAIHPMTNVWPQVDERRVRFKLDEQEWLQAELEATRQGHDIVGIFHSHPDHPAVASPRDLAWASWPGYAYLITEVREGRAVGSRAWQLRADRTDFIEEPLLIQPPAGGPGRPLHVT